MNVLQISDRSLLNIRRLAKAARSEQSVCFGMLRAMSESATKLELIAILDDVFRRRGYEGATLSELSRACNLGKASLYHHFPGGKEEMATVLLRRAIAELNDIAFRQLDRPGPWRERLSGFV